MTTGNANSPILSVVMNTCNIKELLPVILGALIKNTKVYYELLICDNFSLDGTYEYIKEFFETNKSEFLTRVEIDRLDSRQPSVNSLNFALDKVGPSSKYICKLDHDLEVCDNWANIIIEFFTKNPTFKLIASGVEKGFDKGFQCWTYGKLAESRLGPYLVWHQEGIAGYMHFMPRAAWELAGKHYNRMNKLAIFGSEDADWSLRCTFNHMQKGYLMNVTCKHHSKKNQRLTDLENQWKGECTFEKTHLQWEDWLKSKDIEIRYT